MIAQEKGYVKKKDRHNRVPVPEWVHQQMYLNPYPKELMLRNNV
jgi:hypothetical protein